MALLCAGIEFHTLFKPSFIFGCFSNPLLWVTYIKLTTAANPVTSVLSNWQSEVSRSFFNGFSNIYFLCLAKLTPSNKERSSVSLLLKYQMLFWFLKFMSGETYLRYPSFVFTKHFPSWECFYIGGYSSGSFLIF